jgi:hypothetical protein
MHAAPAIFACVRACVHIHVQEVEQAVAAAAIPEGVPGISLGMVAKIKTVARAQHQRRLAAKARRKARERAEEEAKAKKQRDATVRR